MGFGTEILFIIALGLLVLGPKRLHAVLGHLAKAKIRFEEASRGFNSELGAELRAKPGEAEAELSQDSNSDRRHG